MRDQDVLPVEMGLVDVVTLQRRRQARLSADDEESFFGDTLSEYQWARDCPSACGLRNDPDGRPELIGFSAGGHLAGLAALAPGAALDASVQFAVLGYAITSMETETYRPARMILLGEDASPDVRRATSLDALVTPSAPPFFLWYTAEDSYVPPEHTYRPAGVPAAHDVPHTVHVFDHRPHSLGLARGAGETAATTAWPT
ncbi:hypothetical protein [Streptomyces mirabilis]|uniref:Uncharacterized protein n=1 Tax=Streptomyces mirabilis TaxID=68239 RepID=A0A1I2L3R5_9ACTN|nr:hypothetical protein [Streptomyces mirabilis]SFF73120.1 hypothetical protein SAMN02787118_111152 [Streptomyces mirabilis]